MSSRSAEIVEQCWNIRTAADYMGVSVAFLRKAVQQRRVPFLRAGSKSVRFRRVDLDRWLEANGCTGIQTRCNEIRDTAIYG